MITIACDIPIWMLTGRWVCILKSVFLYNDFNWFENGGPKDRRTEGPKDRRTACQIKTFQYLLNTYPFS